MVGSGASCNLKHICAILAQAPQAPLCLGFLFLRMPEIWGGNPDAEQERAIAYIRSHPRETRSALTLEVRLADKDARWCWALLQVKDGVDPHTVPCRRCGTFTASWCEGCYYRTTERMLMDPLQDPLFRAVCSVCDRAHRVCDLCENENISWSQGHAAYHQHEGGAEETEDPETTRIQVTGLFDTGGRFTPVPPVPGAGLATSSTSSSTPPKRAERAKRAGQ